MNPVFVGGVVTDDLVARSPKDEMGDVIEVDYEAMLDAARREAEMWRTAKDQLAVRLNAAEADNIRLNQMRYEQQLLAERAEAEASTLRETRDEAYRLNAFHVEKCARLAAQLDAIEAMLTKKKRMGTLFDVQQIRACRD